MGSIIRKLQRRLSDICNEQKNTRLLIGDSIILKQLDTQIWVTLAVLTHKNPLVGYLYLIERGVISWKSVK